MLKYVALEKRLKKGGKKRGREPGIQGKEGGRFEPPPPLPLKRCQLDDATDEWSVKGWLLCCFCHSNL